FRAERLGLSVATLRRFREAEPREILRGTVSGKAKPYRTECGKAATPSRSRIFCTEYSPGLLSVNTDLMWRSPELKAMVAFSPGRVTFLQVFSQKKDVHHAADTQSE